MKSEAQGGAGDAAGPDVSRELEDLGQVMTGPEPAEALRRHGLVDRFPPIFGRLEIGVIRWKRTDLPLLTPNPVDAFAIKVSHEIPWIDFEGGQFVPKVLVIQDPSPVGTFFDGDRTFHEIRFLIWASSETLVHRVEISFTPAAVWQHSPFFFPFRHQIAPNPQTFQHTPGNTHHLVPFDVTQRILIDIPFTQGAVAAG